MSMQNSKTCKKCGHWSKKRVNSSVLYDMFQNSSIAHSMKKVV